MSKPAHVVSISGGKDSTALYLLALERREAKGREFTAVFADTGNEHELTYEAVRTLAAKTGGPEPVWVRADFTKDFARKRIFVETKWPEHGVPDDVVRRAVEVLSAPTGNPFLDLCIMKGRFPGSKTRFCTDELKIRPMCEQLTLPLVLSGHAIISWQGVRAEESLARRDLPKWQRLGDVYGVKVPAGVEPRIYAYRPLIDWKLTDVWAMHAKHGIDRNPLYEQGMGRVGCMPCIMAKKSELREIAARFPDHVERIAEWERIVTLTAKRGNATFFCLSDDPTWSDGDAIDTAVDGIHRRVAWSKTSRGGKQFDMGLMTDMGTSCNQWGACE